MRAVFDCFALALERLRKLRDASNVVRRGYLALREPWYLCLTILFPRGMAMRLPIGLETRIHPRFLGMRLEQYEPDVAQLIVERVKPGMVALDVGAHVGLHTLRLSRAVGASGRVIAIEASPVNVALLRRHLEWNGCDNVTVIEAAVGATDGEIEFAFRESATDPGGFANSLAYDIGGARVKAALRSLDSICQDLAPDFIKIDIEGAEALAVAGAHSMLERCAPVLMIAFHPDALRALDAAPVQIVQGLDALGYCGKNMRGEAVADPAFEEVVFEKVAR
jgi:FkbM family methyltransferase